MCGIILIKEKTISISTQFRQKIDNIKKLREMMYNTDMIKQIKNDVKNCVK